MEARTEHPGARTLTTVVGIDLGTTNCALAWAEPRGPVQIYQVPQLVAPGDLRALETLPSFLYRSDAAQRSSGTVRLPWDAAPEFVAGAFARDEGALVPSRQIASAKSWLANARVDRTAPLLPWGADADAKLSPVDASARLLLHLRDAWNHEHAAAEDARRLERQDIVLTVPASFDEEARELTAAAARAAGFERLTLLEEPLAALYAWISAHRRDLRTSLGDATLILVCDVGGGTTDFSLIRARLDGDELDFERTAIGEHLLLGGDNLDLALAAVAEQKLAGARLTLMQRQVLRRKCTAAKEHLLSDPSTDRLPITVLGSGGGVVGGGLTTELTREDVRHALETGFLPLSASDDLPGRDRRAGLRELGLPYETEPAITRHLAAFLRRAGATHGDPMAQPDAVLFNGGFFAPALARERVLDALASWFGGRPSVLGNVRPAAAVAFGAAFYGRLRRDPEAAARLVIRAGSARAYYVGVARAAVPDQAPSGVPAICVLPRGTDEGTRFEVEREFTVTTNRPAAFTLYSSRFGTDPLGALVTLPEHDEVTRHAPLVTALRFGKRSRSVPIGVRLSVTYTETGTLELWCGATHTEHRWRLAFNLRGIEADPLDEAGPSSRDAADPVVVIAEEALAQACERVRHVFAGAAATQPATLVGELEETLGHGKQAWPLGALRTLADVLLETERGRVRDAAHEVRWLNLTGFCMRPGFGSASDAWRVSELRKVYAAGLAFPREVQNQVEWLVLWQRVGAGFAAAQQRELAQRIAAQAGVGVRKPPRINPQIERESWRLLASLERLDSGQRARLGEHVLPKIRREPRNASWVWALGRFGARVPLYGPLNTVVPPSVAERWLEELLTLRDVTPEIAAAAAQIGARTGDAARDIPEERALTAAQRLGAGGFPELAERLRSVVDTDAADTARVFGEALPEGLHLR